MARLSQDLFRACKKNKAKSHKISEAFIGSEGRGSLYPLYVGYIKSDGYSRDPDVSTYTVADETWIHGVEDRDENGKPFVRQSEGVSLNTASGIFGFSGFFYFLLPQGTTIPPSLDVVQSGRKGHYVIRCRIGMSKVAYEGALDNLARSAIARSVELGKAALNFEKE